MSIKNIFSDNAPYPSVTVNQWSGAVAAVNNMYPETFAPSTSGQFGFITGSFTTNDSSSYACTTNNRITFLKSGIYKVDFYLVFTAGLSITCVTSPNIVSGNITVIASSGAEVVEAINSFALQTFILEVNGTGTFYLQNVVSAGTTGLIFSDNSSIIITRL